MQAETKTIDINGAINEVNDLAVLEEIADAIKRRRTEVKKQLRKHAASLLARDDRIMWTDDAGEKHNGVVKRKNGTNILVLVTKNGAADLQSVDPLRARKV